MTDASLSPAEPRAIRVLVVDDMDTTVTNISKILGLEPDIEVCGSAASGPEAQVKAVELSPDVVLMDVNMPNGDGITATELLTQDPVTQDIPVIVMSVQAEREYIRRAMQSGAREFLVKPFRSEEVVVAIRRVHTIASRTRSLRLAQEQAAAAQAGRNGRHGARDPRALGRVIGIYSPKSGSGVSMLAANLAAALTLETGARVALVDLDPQFGDQGVLLGIAQDRGWLDLIEAAEIDPETLRTALVSVPLGDARVGADSGADLSIMVLTTPIKPEDGDRIDAAMVARALDLLREEADFVVVDIGAHLKEPTLQALERADTVVLVARADLAGIKNCKLAIGLFARIWTETDRQDHFLYVLNSHDGIDRPKDSLESLLGARVSLLLSSDRRTVGRAAEQASPFVFSHPETDISRDIRRLVDLLLPESAEQRAATAPERNRSRLALFGRR